MWRLIEQAQSIQNSIIRAEVQMKKLKIHNSINFAEENEFMEVSTIKQLHQTDEDIIEVQFAGNIFRFQKEDQWESIKDRIQSVCGRKMTEEGIEKMKKILALSFLTENEQSPINQPLQVIQEPTKNILVAASDLTVTKKPEKLNMKKFNSTKNHVPAKGKQNNRTKKTAYIDIHQRKKETIVIR